MASAAAPARPGRAAAPAPAPARRAPPLPARRAPPLPARRAPAPPRAAAPKGPDFSRAAEQAQEFARRTSESFSEFVKQQELDKKAAAAYEDAQQSLRTGCAAAPRRRRAPSPCAGAGTPHAQGRGAHGWAALRSHQWPRPWPPP
jgi:hypothetical protein